MVLLHSNGSRGVDPEVRDAAAHDGGLQDAGVCLSPISVLALGFAFMAISSAEDATLGTFTSWRSCTGATITRDGRVRSCHSQTSANGLKGGDGVIDNHNALREIITHFKVRVLQSAVTL